MGLRLHIAVSAAALAVALVLAPSIARADVVVHDGGVSRDREAAAWVKQRSGHAPTRVLDPDDVLKGPTRLLTGGATVERCEGRPVDIDAPGRLDQITDRVLSFDLEAAFESMRILDTLLPCSDKPVQARELARLAFLRGATLFDMGDEQTAAESMLEAAVFDIEYTGELGFPGPHLELLASMRVGAAELTASRLYVWTPPGTNEILVDGLPADQIRKQGIGLRRGLHLLQIVQAEGLGGMWVRLEEDAATLVFPNSGRRLWADGGRSPGGELAMKLLIGEVFQGKEGDIHLIHYRAREPMAATFPTGGADRVVWAEAEPPRSTRAGGTGDKGPGRRPRRGEKPVKTDPDPPEDGGQETASGGDEPADGGDPDGGEQPADGDEPGGDEPTDPGEGGDGQTDTVEPTDEDPVTDGGELPTDGGEQPTDEQPTDEQPTDEQPTDEQPVDGDPTDGGDPGDGQAATDPVDEPGGARIKPAGPKQKRFRAALTFGYQYVHPFSYGMLGVDVTVGIWGPLQAGLFVRPSYGGNKQFPGMPEVMGPVMFMPMGISFGVRRPGWLSPFVNGAVQFAYNRDGLRAQPFLGGAVLQGGLDIAPGDSFFMIRVQGEAGFIGRVFNARIGAGVGARF